MKNRSITCQVQRRKTCCTILFLTAFTLLTLFAARDRACAATRTWVGLGGDPFWTTTGNWSSGTRPATADDVLFPTGTPQLATVNNWTGALHSITFGVGGYTISGNSLILTNGINATNTTGQNTLVSAIFLGANQSFTNLNADTRLVLVTLDLSGRSATFRGAGTNLVASVISDSAGGGSLANAGTGVFQLSGTNSSFTGPTALNAGTNLGAFRSWNGSASNNVWSNPTNWSGNVAPSPGDDLFFTRSGSPPLPQATNFNDFADDTTFGSLHLRITAGASQNMTLKSRR